MDPAKKKPIGRTRSVDSIDSLCSLDSFKYNPFLHRSSKDRFGQSFKQASPGKTSTCDSYARLCSPLPYGGKTEAVSKHSGGPLANSGRKETVKRVPSDVSTVSDFRNSPIKSLADSPVEMSPPDPLNSPSFIDYPRLRRPLSPIVPAKASSPDGQIKKRVLWSPEPPKSPSFTDNKDYSQPSPPKSPSFIDYPRFRRPLSPNVPAKASSPDGRITKSVLWSPEPPKSPSFTDYPRSSSVWSNWSGQKAASSPYGKINKFVPSCPEPAKSPPSFTDYKDYKDYSQPSPRLSRDPSPPKASSPGGQTKKLGPWSPPEPAKSPSFIGYSSLWSKSSQKASNPVGQTKKPVPSSPEPWRMDAVRSSDCILKQESVESYVQQLGPPQKTASIPLGGEDQVANPKGTVAKAGGKLFKPVIKLFKKANKTATSLLRTNFANQVGQNSQPVEDEESLDLPTVPLYKIREEYIAVRRLPGKSQDLKNFMLNPDKPLSAYSKVEPRMVIDFLARHMNEYYELVLSTGMTAKRSELLSRTVWDKLVYLIPPLCHQLVELLRKEPLIVEVAPNVVVFGKLLGNFNDLWHIYVHYLNNPAFANYRFIFLGGYVDRGPKPIELLCLLFALKLAYPGRFILLRGNHEVMKVNQKYGFQRLVHHIYGRTYVKHQGIMAPLVYRSFNEVFTFFPLGALIKGNDRSIFCCHGGVPSRYPKSNNSSDTAASNKPWTIAELNGLAKKPLVLTPSKKASPALRTLSELLWNIPMPKSIQKQKRQSHFYPDLQRGGHSSVFSQAALDAFLEANRLSRMIRGNQIKHTRATGHTTDYNGRLLSVFSCSNYCGLEGNTTACVVVTGDDGDEQLAVEVRKLRDPKESGIFRYFNYLRIGIDTRTNQTVEMRYM